MQAEDSHWLGWSLCWHPFGVSNPTYLPLISTKAPLLEVPSSNPITCGPRSVCLWNDIQGKTWHVSRSTFRADLWSGVQVENRLCSVGMDTSSFSLSQAEPPGFLKFIYHRAPNLLGNQLRVILHSTNFPLPLLDSGKAPVISLTRICSSTNPSIKYPQQPSLLGGLRSSPEHPVQVTVPWQITFTSWFPTPSFSNRENWIFFPEKKHVDLISGGFFC